MKKQMKLGVFDHGWWQRACEATSQAATVLPVAHHPENNYAADLEARIANGTALRDQLAETDIDFLLDNGGTGLAFIRNPPGSSNVDLLHEAIGKPLVSHFIDPLTIALQGLEWPLAFQCLLNPQWAKAVWDRAHATELARFGIGNVIHLPMAAPNRQYDTTPLDPGKCANLVSFVGGQNTKYFFPNHHIQGNNLTVGTIAQAAQCDAPGLSFFDIYHDVYQLGERVNDSDTPKSAAEKSMGYFGAKLFFYAQLCMRNRDRFVIFLKQKMGDKFRLIGARWDEAYGLPCEPALASTDDYFAHFRQTAINLNLVNGNAETGLNMRHFEITAAGGFMLCYKQPELAECFEIGKECAVFESEQDLLEKIDHYLQHPEERVAIALAGQRRTLTEHLYSHRLMTLIEKVKRAPARVTFSQNEWTDDLKKLVPAPNVVLDCGANKGQTAGTFRRMYPTSTIYSFEPVRGIYEELVEKAKSLGTHAVPLAVGDRNGKATINLTAGPEANSLLEFEPGNPCAQWTRVVGTEEIDVCTLDKWCEGSDIDPHDIDVIKMDLQGGELAALHGAKKLLKTARAVFMEVSFVKLYKDCPLFDEVDRFMTECGYGRAGLYPSDQPQNWGDALYIKGN